MVQESDAGEANPLVSIVIPAKNEREDIADTLEACLAMTYEPKEIIVADDSTDDTPDIVAGYADRGVRLLHRERNENGCCGARNAGMRAARGEIVVLVNADDRPQADFLDRVMKHYQGGADLLVVESEVLNPETPWARFVHGSHLTAEWDVPAWSEGFSCRRRVAEAVGFIPGDFPIPFCRDALFGETLEASGFRKHYDPSIPMPHRAPSTFHDFWNNRVWRGSFSAPYSFYVRGLPMPLVAAREIARAGRTLLKDLLLVSPIRRAWGMARAVGGGFGGLFVATVVCDAATVLGGMRGLRRLIRQEGITARGQDPLRATVAS